ncbi:MAG: hypothetical protein QM607_09560 [Microbacterium sp.]
MRVFRRAVLPVVWIILAAIIATALVKLAFFSDGASDAQGEDGYMPTGELSEPMYTVGRDTVRTDLNLSATVMSDPAVDVTVAKDGDVVDVFASVGQQVAKGDVLASVKRDVENADGEEIPIWSEITAPADGTLSA